jgi:WD40 repeat protein
MITKHIKLMESFIGHSGPVMSVALLNDGKPTKLREGKGKLEEGEALDLRRIASAGNDNVIRVWDLRPCIERVYQAKYNISAQSSRMF